MGTSLLTEVERRVWYWINHTRRMTPAERREWQQRRQPENTYSSAHYIAGVCKSYNFKQVRDMLVHGRNMLGRANKASLAGAAAGLGKREHVLSAAVDDMNRMLARGADFAGNATAACDIADAIVVLNHCWLSHDKGCSEADAARAFDKLFGGAGRYMEALPPPLNQYARIFHEIAQDNFFANMQRAMNPLYTSEGPQLRAAMNE